MGNKFAISMRCISLVGLLIDLVNAFALSDSAFFVPPKNTQKYYGYTSQEIEQ